MNLIYLKFYSLFLLIIIFTFSGIASAEDIRIALRAHKGAVKSLSLWQATADHLSQQIPEHRFIMVPFENIGVMGQAISRGDFKFSIANPASVVEYQILYGFEPIASLVNKRQGKGYSKFGSVIFTRADRKDINSFNALKGKSLISVDELAFGGWRVAWKEFIDNNINPYDDFKVIRFAGGTQQEVVYAVRDRKDDAGVVRTDMLERMAESGKIKLSDFKVLGQKKSDGFPFLHSTDLYPEWAFSSVANVDPELRAKIVKALLSIRENDTAAIKGLYVTWIKPQDLSPVRELLEKLKVGPYNIATMSPYSGLISQYGIWVITIIVVFVFLIAAILYVLRLNKNILSAKDALKEETKICYTLEQQLMHSQRIESLGQLTGGIAHDFNNMLASIIGFTELALQADKVKEDSKLKNYLNQVITASEKSTALVNQMLMFSRSERGSNKKEDIFVSALVNEVCQLLVPVLPSSLNLIVKDIDENSFINVNSGNITQVLMNLYLNAKDAIATEHGTISISTEAVNFKALDVFCDSCHQDIRGSYIAICIEDNGSGIGAEIKKHLFEPFFTTKEVGKGTGMGLSMVHGIIHKHDGHIIIESEVGSGTTIKILLPQVSQSEIINVKDKIISEKDILSISSNKHIMIVDDEVSLTVYLTEFLRQKGFKVTSFNDSEKAVHYFEKHFDEIDLVITDQTMPNLTGIELSEKMYTISGDIPIILCSGYSEGVDEKIKSSVNVSLYMEKPINSDKLLESIYSLLK